MNTRMTVIVDNIAQGDLKGEWGLSILVEHQDQKILMDAGGSDLFVQNMKALGFCTEDVDYAVLSHAHYDHANGMPRFLKENQKAKFYLREGAGENCYSKHFIFKNYIGIPKNALRDYADRIQFAAGDYRLCEGAYLIPHKTKGLEKNGKREGMYQKTAKGLVPDDFSHEQSLVLETDKGLVIINCCCHGGAVNIVNEVRNTFPNQKVYGLIGGFHLFNKSEAEIRNVARELRDTGIEYVCTGHCTGKRAYHLMKDELGNMVQQLHVGFNMEF